MDAGQNCFRVTLHARSHLKERWPCTLFRPDFDAIVVPKHAPFVGYDPNRSAQYFAVEGGLMVAVVVDECVCTFLTWEQARFNLSHRGYWFGDSKPTAA